ncbi:MAG: hypothetical protein ACRDTU_05025 [Micromonosporaceae bacterium]
MDTPDGGGGGDAFAGKLRTKAHHIAKLAVEKRAEDINDFVGRGMRLPLDDEHLLYGTRTGQVVAVEVVPGTLEWATLEKHYAWVADSYGIFTRLPDPRGFVPLVEAMEKTLKVFGGESGSEKQPDITDTAWGNMNSTQIWITGWYGDAATQFAKFADPFEEIGNNHAALADALLRGAAATGKVFANARKDVDNIADATIGALKGKSPGGGDDLVVVLSVVATVAGFIASVPTLGATLAIGFAGAAALASLAKDTMPAPKGEGEESKVEVVIGGHTVDAIISSMSQELSRLNRFIEDEETEIKRILEDNHSEILVPRNRKKVEAPRPDLADLTSGPIRPNLSPPV